MPLLVTIKTRWSYLDSWHAASAPQALDRPMYNVVICFQGRRVWQMWLIGMNEDRLIDMEAFKKSSQRERDNGRRTEAIKSEELGLGEEGEKWKDEG